jgi:hypothetical protein
MTVFWDAVPRGLVEIDQRFRDAYCLHHQGATTQKTVIFKLAAVRISNLTLIEDV